MSGLSLGAVASCKWAGFFTVGTIGLSTIHQHWLLCGDLRVSPCIWLHHFIMCTFWPILFWEWAPPGPSVISLYASSKTPS
ncbi:hypothetical protein DFH07DRAFT_1003413 [Mycena maculata]|uniref:ArnT-like N-terminal domain-containing protein n=1 Tax=Mycena maculata TaxID=230809 RepID=A0AAD7MN49_9AGAR|nr:hypothetical protein DFH07DRAFT_1003413 [Mycena maculata]